MKKALIAMAVCGATQPALAQWGLYGFSAEGLVYQIDEFTGDIALVGDIGVPVVGAASDFANYDPLEVVVLTADDRILSVNLRNLESTVLVQLTGRPNGYVPVAFGGGVAVLRPPSGDDILFAINRISAEYTEIGPTGLNDVSGMTNTRISTSSGGVYQVNFVTGQTSLVWSVNNGDRVEAIARAECGDIVTGEGMYIFKSATQQLVQIQSAGFSDIVALAYSSAHNYACDSLGGELRVCDLFDFLAYQQAFVSSEPWACDCDTSTGSGVCDLFDFLCFQNAFVYASQAPIRCR